MPPPTDLARARLATRLAFLVAGFVMGCWSPLVPYAQTRLGVDAAGMGGLLLCLGLGSLAAMPVAGLVSVRFGARAVIVASGLGLAAILPATAHVAAFWAMAAVLAAFGAALGALDVAMNAHAAEVEAASDRPLMSGFHALFSVGGFAGAGGMTALLAAGAAPFAAAACCALLALAATIAAAPRLLPTRGTGEGASFARPRGAVLLLAALAGIAFLVEGAILDWGALLITQAGLVGVSRGGLGYMVFSVAMTGGRFAGDRVVGRFGGRRILVWGGAATVAGLLMLLLAPTASLAIGGFLLVGLGASNIVPVLFSQAGRLGAVPAGQAIAAVTTAGYAGILAGPPVIGLVADAASLPTAFLLLAALFSLVPLAARRATRGDRCPDSRGVRLARGDARS